MAVLLSFEALLISALILVLLVCSAFISGSEVAFFSLKDRELAFFKEKGGKISEKILQLHEKPRLLLATILVSNNMVNIAIIILFTILTNMVIGISENPVLAFVVEVIALTFLLVLFGEVVPKVSAAHNNKQFANIMAYPLFILMKIFYPVSGFLVKHSSSIERRIERNRRSDVSPRELKEAIEITSDESTSGQENKILKGLVNFGNINVRQIMKPRTDVIAFDKKTTYTELQELIRKNPYSRVPVFEESFDNITGILYIKDLLNYLDKDDSFDWTKLLRNPYFVPESKKIDDLLREFQELRVHMAIVVDEYGGTSGIITMEDVLEEIVGEIGDEFDEDANFHYQLDENTFIFEGKTPLNDVVRMIGVDDEFFDNVKGDAETIGGLLLELEEQIPEVGKQFEIGDLTLKVEGSDNKRVRRVRLTINKVVKEEKKSKEKKKKNSENKK